MSRSARGEFPAGRKITAAVARRVGEAAGLARRLTVFRNGGVRPADPQVLDAPGWIGAVTIVPGAAMPGADAEPVRLVLRIGHAQARSRTGSVTLELLGVVGAWLRLPRRCRELLDLVPVARLGAQRIIEIDDPAKIDTWLDQALAEKRKIMGIGHAVYKTEDPRATWLRRYSKHMGEKRAR